MYAFPNMPAYANLNPTCLFPNPLGSVTPFVYWIEDYPLPDGLKMPSHIGSYDGKGDPKNFLHIFEGAIRMQKWLMPVACHMFTYTLKDSARIWWNSQKAGEHPLLRTETLNIVIVKSDSPHNMLLGRTTMQKMGIVVSTIYGAIKFHTKKGVRTVLSVGEARDEMKKARRTLTINKERIPSCDDTEEKIIVNDKYPEQMVTIEK
ncbi:hypothetical protein Tco_0359418 [Tanacetum coccineum]